jgi:Xaa-Pro aminopeptidase
MKKSLLISLSILLCLSAFAQTEPDALSKDWHKQRRGAFRTMMPSNSVAVFFANPIRNRANDVDYDYHQDPDFYYLTGYKEANSLLLVFSEPQSFANGVRANEILFAQERNPTAEMWNGRRLGIEGVKNVLGFEHAYNGRDFKDFALDFGKFDKVMFFNFYNDVRDTSDPADLFDLIAQFKEKSLMPENFSADRDRLYTLIKTTTVENHASVAQVIGRSLNTNARLGNDQILQDYVKSTNPENRLKIAQAVPQTNLDISLLPNLMAELREIKTAEEIDLLRKAVNISAQGQIEVMKSMHPDMSEREIQGIHEFVFKKYNAESIGYGSIVGAGENGCILHYVENSTTRVGDKLVLMDLGAQYRGYTADVTRTIPANGKFSPEQKAIYDLVYAAQEAAFAECKPGNSFRAPHTAAQRVINEGLVKLGIIEQGQRHTYFPHGTSHYLGLDVHDRGTFGNFRPNTVITVEPGIYIPEGSPCDPKWWGIAVRIEDCVLITDKGWENLSAAAPRKSDEIEAMMKQEGFFDKLQLPKLQEIR